MVGVVVPGSNVVVDTFAAFSQPVLYFLTHAHTDHLTGLKRGWDRGVIHCTAITRDLVVRKFGLPAATFVTLEEGETTTVCLPGGSNAIGVTPLDANHCPGAVMFVFEGPFGTVLHTGDFRYTPTMLEHPVLQRHVLLRVPVLLSFLPQVSSSRYSAAYSAFSVILTLCPFL